MTWSRVTATTLVVGVALGACSSTRDVPAPDPASRSEGTTDLTDLVAVEVDKPCPERAPERTRFADTRVVHDLVRIPTPSGGRVCSYSLDRSLDDAQELDVEQSQTIRAELERMDVVVGESGRACRLDLGPTYVVILQTGESSMTTVVEAYGCQNAWREVPDSPEPPVLQQATPEVVATLERLRAHG